MVQQAHPSLIEFVDGSSVRRKLLEHLARGPMTPTELASLEGKHVSHVSRALKEMKDLGLVESMGGRSRERYYKITTPGYFAYASLARIT